MELSISRKEYDEALEKVEEISKDSPYLNRFSITFPDGLNTASVMEICRIVQDTSFEAKLRLARICIAGRNVKITCPNGDVESFKLGTLEDSFDGFPIFQKDPFALIALCDSIYGYVIKKSIRSSPAPKKPITQQ